MKKLVLLLAILAAPAGAQSGPFLWRYQPPAGSKWTLNATQVMTVSRNSPATQYGQTKVPAMGFSSNLQQSSITDIDVLSKDAAGDVTSRLTFREITLKMSTEMKGVNLPKKGLPRDAACKLTSRELNTPLVIKYSPRGELLDVKGLEQFSKKLQARAQASKGNIGERTLLGQLMVSCRSKESFAKSLVDAPHIPASAISPGQKSNFTVDLRGLPVSKGQISVTRVLTGRKAGLATFSETGPFSDSISMPQGFTGKKITLGMQTRGTYGCKRQVDEKTGLNKTIDIDIRATMTSTFSGKDAPKLPKTPTLLTRSIHATLNPRS